MGAELRMDHSIVAAALRISPPLCSLAFTTFGPDTQGQIGTFAQFKLVRSFAKIGEVSMDELERR